MARILVVSLLALLTAGNRAAEEAYQRFWTGFERHSSGDKGPDAALQRWLKEGLKEEATKDRHRQVQNRKHLEKAEHRYREQLRESSAPESRPGVLLNLAETILLRARLLGDSGLAEDALPFLEELAGSGAERHQKERGLHLMAMAKSLLGRPGEAARAWQTLTRSKKPSIYQAEAHLALGRQLFGQENARRAKQHFALAVKILAQAGVKDRSIIVTEAHYRLMWAGYRDVDTRITQASALALLAPRRAFADTEAKLGMVADAIAVLANTLVDAVPIGKVSAAIAKDVAKSYAPFVGLQVVRRLTDLGRHSDVAVVGSQQVASYLGFARVFQVIDLTASAYKKLGQPDHRARILEKAGHLLPADSLWNRRHRDPALVAEMQTAAIRATAEAARWHFERALAIDDRRHFQIAASLYGILAAAEPAKTTWRLQRANCAYFGGAHADAEKDYALLLDEGRADESELRVARYQRVLNREKMWRQAVRRQDEDPKGRTRATDNYLAAIRDYATAHADEARSIDLLLAGASALREGERLSEAEALWRQVLAMSPPAMQREIALRGLVFSSLQQGDPVGTAREIADFLRLEDWSELSSALRKELTTIMSQTLSEGSAQLQDQGRIAAAGQLLSSAAKEFRDLAGRLEHHRNGAYLLAIAGHWHEAIAEARWFQDQGFRKFAGDMAYLLAKGYEYTLAFPEAAASYYAFSRRFATHSRSRIARERAIRLATATKAWELVGKAQDLAASRTRKVKEQQSALRAACEAYLKAALPAPAEKAAERLVTISPRGGPKLSARLLRGRVYLAQGREALGREEIRTVAQRAAATRASIDKEIWSPLVGEANHWLARKPFEALQQRLSTPASSIAELDRRLEAFDRIRALLDRSIGGDDPAWATRGRFELGDLADDLSSGVRWTVAQLTRDMPPEGIQRYQQKAVALATLAREYFGRNLLERVKRPHLFRDDVWMKRSILRMASQAETPIDQLFHYAIPYHTAMELPYKWSI